MKRALLAVAFALALAACGGSGSGGGDDEGGTASGIAGGASVESGGDAESAGDAGSESSDENDGAGTAEGGLPSEFSGEYADVERCTRLRGAEPNLVLEEPRPCPTSGRMCCLPSVENFECGLLGLSRCGASGLYDPETRTIHLPDGCPGAFRHEAIHHLLFVNGRADWQNHGAIEFLCQ